MALTRKLIVKYLRFFVDESERLVGEHELDKVHLDSLKREFDRFLDEMKATPEVDPRIVAKLCEIQFNPRRNPRRTPFNKFLRVITFPNALNWQGMFAREELRKIDIRDIIVEFRDRISHLLYAVDTFKLPTE